LFKKQNKVPSSLLLFVAAAELTNLNSRFAQTSSQIKLPGAILNMLCMGRRLEGRTPGIKPPQKTLVHQLI